MKFVYDDGGRAAAGYKGEARDCVCRAVAIACELPYQAAYDLINQWDCKQGRKTRKTGRTSAARSGVYKGTQHALMTHLGWTWNCTMRIGQGCKVHLRDGELPMGRLIVSVSKHLVAVIDGVVHDTHDPTREGNRCVYGFWTKGLTP
jgi:hypothetical protein